MDTIAIILLTAFINIVVTSIVSNIIFLRYQKKIENSFATSLFEHQTKFVRNHEKAVETLEALYKKYMVASQFILSHLSRVSEILSVSNKNEMETFDFTASIQNLDEFWIYFVNNRLFLSDDIAEDLGNIHRNSFDIIKIVVVVMAIVISNAQDPINFLGVNEIIKKSRLTISELDGNTPNIKKLLEEAKKEIDNQVLKVERVYKSVADIKAKP